MIGASLRLKFYSSNFELADPYWSAASGTIASSLGALDSAGTSIFDDRTIVRVRPRPIALPLAPAESDQQQYAAAEHGKATGLGHDAETVFDVGVLRGQLLAVEPAS